MRDALKRILSFVPSSTQQFLKRIYFKYQLHTGKFITDEPEFELLGDWVKANDWVLDIGANIGHYTCRLSNITGSNGRVIAMEPVPDTFSLLSSNICTLENRNVTLLNVAASDETGLIGLSIPKFDTGLDNYYRAHSTQSNPDLQVLCIKIDSLYIPQKVKLAKIDVEGHEMSVLKGMRNLIERDHPILVIEDNSADIAPYLDQFGYSGERLDSSPNILYTI